jgi:hypothetical protein
MCGVSRQAIGKAVKAKNIKMIRGKVDLDHRLTCEYYHDKTGKNLKLRNRNHLNRHRHQSQRRHQIYQKISPTILIQKTATPSLQE